MRFLRHLALWHAYACAVLFAGCIAVMPSALECGEPAEEIRAAWEAQYRVQRELERSHISCQRADAAACMAYEAMLVRQNLPPLGEFSAAHARHRACLLGNSSACQAGEPVAAGQLESPTALERPGQLVYPTCARRFGLEGVVVVRVLVSKAGTVRRVVPIHARPVAYFEDSTISYVETWRFRPASKNGVPVEAWVTQRVHYRLTFR